MKTLILIFAVIFLSACALSEGPERPESCPSGIAWYEKYVLQYEYGSARMNADAQARITEVARRAAAEEDFVCLSAETAYRGRPQESFLTAAARAENAARLFLDVGVGIEKIYIGIEPQTDKTGLDAPIRPSEEVHRMVIRLGKQHKKRDLRKGPFNGRSDRI